MPTIKLTEDQANSLRILVDAKLSEAEDAYSRSGARQEPMPKYLQARHVRDYWRQLRADLRNERKG